MNNFEKPVPMEGQIVEALKVKVSSLDEGGKQKLKEIWEEAGLVDGYFMEANESARSQYSQEDESIKAEQQREEKEALQKEAKHTEKLKLLISENVGLLPDGMDFNFIMSHFRDLSPVLDSLS
jgi:hypothetical protein